MSKDQEVSVITENAQELLEEAVISAPVAQAPAKTHLQVWQKVEQWSQKLDDKLKAEFAQFVEEYKNLI